MKPNKQICNADICVQDLTRAGVCSRCGECCSDILPVTVKELKAIRNHIAKNGIKPISKVRIFPELVIEMLCPFYNVVARCCLIYSVRPEICKVFKCNQSVEEITRNRERLHNVKQGLVVSMHHTFVAERYVKCAIESVIAMNPMLCNMVSRVDW